MYTSGPPNLQLVWCIFVFEVVLSALMGDDGRFGPRASALATVALMGGGGGRGAAGGVAHQQWDRYGTQRFRPVFRK